MSAIASKCALSIYLEPSIIGTIMITRPSAVGIPGHSATGAVNDCAG